MPQLRYEEQQVVDVLFGVIWALSWLIHVPALYMFWKRRHLQPLYGRVPMLSFISSVLILVLLAFSCMYAFYIDTYPCDLAFWQGGVLITAAGTIYLLRCWVLIFNFELTISQFAELYGVKGRERPAEAVEAAEEVPTEEILGYARYAKEETLLGGRGSVVNGERKFPKPLDSVDSEMPAANGHTPEVSQNGGRYSVSVSDGRRRSVHVSRHQRGGSTSLMEENIENALARHTFVLGNNWYMRHRHYMTTANLAKFFFSVFGLAMLPLAIIQAVSPLKRGPDSNGSLGCPNNIEHTVTAFIMLLFVCAFLGFALKMREVFDGFFIMKELKATALVVTIFTIAWAALLDGTKASEKIGFPLHTLVTLVEINVVVALAIHWPLYRSYRWQGAQNDASTRPISSSTTDLTGKGPTPHDWGLVQVLEHPTGQRLFRAHLVAEFNLENLIFWEGVHFFRREVSLIQQSEEEEDNVKRRRCFAIGLDLYHRCIRDGAVHQVNIDYSLREPLDRFFGHATAISGDADLLEMQASRVDPISITIFDDVMDSIIHLMETDPFQRFRSSEAYNEFITARLNERQEARAASVVESQVPPLPSLRQESAPARTKRQESALFTGVVPLEQVAQLAPMGSLRDLGTVSKDGTGLRTGSSSKLQ